MSKVEKAPTTTALTAAPLNPADYLPTTVEHMDDVLRHALAVDDPESLFHEADEPFLLSVPDSGDKPADLLAH